MTKNLKGLPELLEEFDKKIGYCTRSECVDLNEIKAFISQAFSLGQQSTLQEVEEYKDGLLNKLKDYEGRYGCENTKHEIITIIKNHKV